MSGGVTAAGLAAERGGPASAAAAQNSRTRSARQHHRPASPPAAGLPGSYRAGAPPRTAHRPASPGAQAPHPAFRPDRSRCTGCGATRVILLAGLLPGRAYAAELIGQALVSAAGGHGHRRIAGDLDVPGGTVRGWIRRARPPAEQLRVIGVRAVVALDPDLLPARVLAGPLGCALDALGAAAVAMGQRLGLETAGLWERIMVLTRGQLLNLAPDG